MPRRFPILAAAFLAASSLAGSAAAGTPGAVGDLYVTNDVDNMTRQYDGSSGSVIGPFFTSSAAVGQMAIHYGDTNNRVLIGHSTGGVEEFNATTGAYIKTYNPSGGWQWAGLYAPDGNVYIGDMSTNDVRKYDSTTGLLIGVLTTVDGPADMRIGPDGNLYICSYTMGYVRVVNAITGAFLDEWAQASGDRSNDIAFLPNGDILVTVMASNVCYHYNSGKVLLGSFSGTGWGRPHGIDISPWDGNIYVADGITTQVHVFDPTTFVELNPAFLSPGTGAKIVDIQFRPEPGPVSLEPQSWARTKAHYR
jgi:WD40 repeat protein